MPGLARAHDRLRAVCDLELREDVRDVVADRLLAEHEVPRHPGVVVALRDQLEHLALALGELGERLRGVARARHREVLDHALRDVGPEDRLAAADRRDRAHDVVLIGALEQVALGAGAHGREDGVVVLEHRQHEHADVRALGDDLARRLDAVELGHVQIHDDDVGLQRLGGGDRLGAGRRLAHDLRLAERREQRAEPSAEDRMVVGDEDANAFHGLLPRAGEGAVPDRRRGPGIDGTGDGKRLARARTSGKNRRVAVNRILAVPEPSGRAVTWAREAADRFEAELAVLALDPDDGDPAASIVREAVERGSDLIVLSDAGMRDRTEFLLANVANRVSARGALQRRLRRRRLGAARRATSRASGCSAARPRSAACSPATGCATTGPRRIAHAGCARRSRSSARRSPSSARCSRRDPTCCRRSSSRSSPGCRTTCRRSPRPRSSPCSRPSSACRGRTRSRTSSPHPLAAGTIAQVHRARLPDGSAVVVKVQRPTAERQILEDLALLELFAEKAGNRPAFERVVDLPAVFAYLSESLRRELDFSIEAASIERIRPLLADFDGSTRRTSISSSRPAACS